MKERYIVAVDLGSYKIRLCVCKIDGEEKQIIYYNEANSSGIQNSAVFNPKKAENIVKELIDDFQKEYNLKVNQIVVNLPKCNILQKVARASITRNNPNESITEEEIQNLKAMAQDGHPDIDTSSQKLYAAIAQSFSDEYDFQGVESDIIGMISTIIKGQFILFIGRKNSALTINKIFNDLKIGINKAYFIPTIIDNTVLTSEEKQNGVALIDFGGGSTSVNIYKDKVLRYYGSIPFGGANITKDIKTECYISENLAENIKLAYGVCMPDKLQNLEDKIISLLEPETESNKEIPIKYISEIITARAKEIINAILYKIQESKFKNKLKNGIVITGGGANLANLANLIREISGYNVRIGVTRHLLTYAVKEDLVNTSTTNIFSLVLEASKQSTLNCTEPLEDNSSNSDNTFDMTQNKNTTEEVNNTTEEVNNPNKDISETQEKIIEHEDNIKEEENNKSNTETAEDKGNKKEKHKPTFKWLKTITDKIGSIYENSVNEE